MNKELNIRIISHPAITEGGVYDVVFEVNGEVVEREFEVGVIADYEHEDETNSYYLEHVAVSAICCNEDDEDIASIMECKLKTVIESCMWERTSKESKGHGIQAKSKKERGFKEKPECGRHLNGQKISRDGACSSFRE